MFSWGPRLRAHRCLVVQESDDACSTKFFLLDTSYRRCRVAQLLPDGSCPRAVVEAQANARRFSAISTSSNGSYSCASSPVARPCHKPLMCFTFSGRPFRCWLSWRWALFCLGFFAALKRILSLFFWAANSRMDGRGPPCDTTSHFSPRLRAFELGPDWRLFLLFCFLAPSLTFQIFATSMWPTTETVSSA